MAAAFGDEGGRNDAADGIRTAHPAVGAGAEPGFAGVGAGSAVGAAGAAVGAAGSAVGAAAGTRTAVASAVTASAVTDPAGGPEPLGEPAAAAQVEEVAVGPGRHRRHAGRRRRPQEP